jgi:large subunit ribosomal protein L18
MNRAGSFLRIVVRRSHRNFSAQVVDDSAGRVLFSLSTSDKALKGQFSKGAGNIKCAEQFGAIFSQKAKEKGLSKIVFDRAGYLYHGRVKAFAEALRKGGLEF